MTFGKVLRSAAILSVAGIGLWILKHLLFEDS